MHERKMSHSAEMESKLIIFLVFASIAQGAYVPRLAYNFGLTDANAAILERIIVNQDSVVNLYFRGVSRFFDTVFDLDAGIQDDLVTVNAALADVRSAIDTYFDSDLLVIGGPCPAVTAAQVATQSHIATIFTHLNSTLQLARAGNYSENRAAIEVHQAAVQANYESSVIVDYNALRSCINSSNVEVLKLIGDSQSGSRTHLIHLTNAIFNALKVHADAVPARCGDKILTLDVEEYRDQALRRIENNIEYKFGFLRSYYIYNNINETGFLTDLFKNQHSLSVTFNKYKKSYEVMYGMLIYYLRRVELGIRDEGINIFGRHDYAVAEVNIRFARSGNMTLDAIPLINPGFAALLAKLRDELMEMSIEGDDAFLQVIDAIVAYRGNNYTELQQIIAHYEDIAIGVYEPSNVLIFQFIRNDMTWSPQLDALLKVLQEEANRSASDASLRFFDGVKLLARCMFEGSVNQTDNDAMQGFIVETYAEVDILLQTLFVSGFYVLQEHSTLPPSGSGAESMIFGESSVFRIVWIQILASIMMYMYN